MTQLDPVTWILKKLMWIFIAVIFVSILSAIYVGGMDFPEESKVPQWQGLDLSAIVVGFGALLMLIVTQIWYPNHGTRLDSFSRWCYLCSWIVIELRFAWIYARIGDLPFSPYTMGAVVVFAIGNMFRCLSIWEQHSRKEDSKSW